MRKGLRIKSLRENGIMANIKHIRLCGIGGQGIVMAGTVLGRAAICDGKWVSGSNSYGAQARGGSARSEVIISDEPILFPHIIHADILVIFSQGEYDSQVLPDRESTPLVFYDAYHVRPNPELTSRQIGVSATDEAIRRLDNKQTANMVMLGAVVAATSIVARSSLDNAVNQSVSRKYLESNLKALKLGFQLGEEIEWQ